MRTKRLIHYIFLLILLSHFGVAKAQDDMSYLIDEAFEEAATSFLEGNMEHAMWLCKTCKSMLPKGKVTNDHVRVYNLMGTIAGRSGDNDQSLKYYEQALSYAEQLNPRQPETEESLRQQIAVMKGLGKDIAYTTKYNEAEARKGQLPLITCFSLVTEGKPDVALASIVNWKEKFESLGACNTEQYFSTVLLLGNCYVWLGMLDEAFNMYSDVITAHADDMSHQYMAIMLSSASTIQISLRNYTLALAYLVQAKLHYELYGKHDLEYIKILASLAQCYVDLEYTFYPKLLFEEAMDLYTQTQGPLLDGPIGISLLNGYSMLCDRMGDKAKAKEGYKQIIDKKELMQTRPDTYNIAKSNYSVMLIDEGRYDEALNLLENISLLNPESEYIRLSNLANASYLKYDAQRARKYLSQFNDFTKKRCTDIISTFSEREREAFWSQISNELLNTNFSAVSYLPQLSDIVYDNSLYTKSLLLLSADIMKQGVESSGDGQLKADYKSLLDEKASLVYGNWNDEERDSITENISDMERSILSRMPDYGEKLMANTATWEDVRQTLSADEAAIEFVILDDTQNKNSNYCHYGAMIVRQNSQIPEVVKLANRDYVDDRLESVQTGDADAISALYTDVSDSSLYALLWKQLEPSLKGIKNVYYSTMSELNSVNFEAIAVGGGKALSQKYNLYRLSTTAKIKEVKDAVNTKFSSADIFGGVAYNETADEMQANSRLFDSASAGADGPIAVRAANDRGQWKMLSGTVSETNDIAKMLKGSGCTATLYQYERANEEAFKGMDAKSPELIHVATHGYNLTADEAKTSPFLANLGKFTDKGNRLLYTGLMMAGAKNAWGGAKVRGCEDGVLTSDEISRLDLSNTKLVVLSACETGKGYNDPVNGVFGLQRAFKKAGVQSIIMSMWEVPDEVTSQLMHTFYENLIKGLDRRQALAKAMDKVRKSHKEPYYWAGFVVLD